jgi:predicted GNAT family acetyltransferase
LAVELSKDRYPEWIDALRPMAAEHAWILQDLVEWPEEARVVVPHAAAMPGEGYLLGSSHPGSQGTRTVVLSGEPMVVEDLVRASAVQAPFVVRETSADLAEVIERHYEDVTVHAQQRMDVTRDTFQAADTLDARQLAEWDVDSLLAFYDAPRQAVEGYSEWIANAFVAGIYFADELLAVGSTMVRLPEIWVLVGIETAPDERGRGYGTAVTSFLTGAGLAEVERVSLTVRKDNAAAIRVYEKLGYQVRDDRVWIDVNRVPSRV